MKEIFFIIFAILLVVSNSYAYEVSGEIIYEGGGLGVYIVALYETIGLPEYFTVALFPGNYSISNVDSGTYFVIAYKDENTNLLPDIGEPVGFYGENFPPVLQVLSDVDSVDIELGDTGADISGEVEVEDGNNTGQFIILPLWYPDVRWIYTSGFPYMGSEQEYSTQVFFDGEYYIGGWRDSNMNYYLDESEPFGFYGGTDPFAITIEDLQDVEDIDFILYYPPSSNVEKGSWGKLKSLFE